MQNWQQTILSQYANSTTLMALIESMNDAIDPASNINLFYDSIWNVDTATGYGLDVWGRIVGIGRNVEVPFSGEFFGFKTGTVPNPYAPFNWGIFRSSTSTATSVFELSDDAYRTLILFKAFSNIVVCNIPSLNALARSLFQGTGSSLYVASGYVADGYYAIEDRSRAYVVDNQNMTMQYVFDFALNTVEAAIVNIPGLLPHPTGVSVTVTHG